MARSDEHAVESLLEVLLTHLLKWRYQPSRRSRSWQVSIQNARSKIRRRLAESPSLKSKLPTLIEDAYESARRLAGVEMELDERAWDALAPASCAWTFETLISDIWPDPVNGPAE